MTEYQQHFQHVGTLAIFVVAMLAIFGLVYLLV